MNLPPALRSGTKSGSPLPVNRRSAPSSVLNVTSSELAPAAECRRQPLVVARAEARDGVAHYQQAIETAAARAGVDAERLGPPVHAERVAHVEGHVACIQRGRRLPKR